MAFILSWSCRCFVLLPCRRAISATPTPTPTSAAESYQATIQLQPRQPSVYRVVYWQPRHLATGHATACPVHKTKHDCCALLLLQHGAVAAVAMQPDVVHIFVSFSAVSAVSVAVFAVLFAISNRMYVLPYPVSSVPLCHYAICRRVPFPDLCNSMHVPHFCSKTCRTCMWRMAATKIPQKVPQMLNLKHVARCTDCSATVLIEFATATATATATV